MRLITAVDRRSALVRPSMLRGALALCGVVVLAGWLAGGQSVWGAEDEDELPKPEDVSLRTKDGLDLKATFYPTYLEKEKKKDAAPIIVLHAWKGDRGDCEEIALDLQAEGYAVITPDLRGHGESTHLVEADGTKIDLDKQKLKKEDFEMMVTNDMEAIKSFLIEKNNDQQLNIEKLGVIGAEMGAVVAINWTAVDWAWPVLSTGKQGQDVKMLVIISPEPNFNGLRISDAMKEPSIQKEISFLIIAGAKNKAPTFSEATKLQQTLSRYHKANKKEIVLFTPDTKLQGTKLLNEESLKINEHITSFIQARLKDQKYPWATRSNPLDTKPKK